MWVLSPLPVGELPKVVGQLHGVAALLLSEPIDGSEPNPGCSDTTKL